MRGYYPYPKGIHVGVFIRGPHAHIKDDHDLFRQTTNNDDDDDENRRDEKKQEQEEKMVVENSLSSHKTRKHQKILL